MRLTLIFPSVGRKENKPYVRAWQMQPLSMAMLASITPPEIEVRFYDDRMEEIPFDEPTDLVAISVETFTALRAYKIARAVSPPRRAGRDGRLPCDALARRGSTRGRCDRRSATPSRSGHNCSTTLVMHRLRPEYRGLGRRSLIGIRPRREIFAGRRYQNISLVEFARGCNFKCDFCAITAFHGASQNHRPANEVVAEMERIESRRFFIVDDNIVSQPAKARELCLEMARLKVHWVGQASIHIAQDDGYSS